MSYTCMGFLELSTIAKGIQVVDALLKKATIVIQFAYPVSSGKYLVGFVGEVEEVKSASFQGREVAGSSLLDFFIIPNLHAEILPALAQEIQTTKIEALGILETVTCAATVIAADAALKTSKVKLLKIQLAKGIGGKAYFVIEGEVADVESAIAAGIRSIRSQGIVDRVIIPQARAELLQILH